VIDRLLDGVLPTRIQPTPIMESTGDRGVVLDRGAAAALDLTICYVLIETPLLYLASELAPTSFLDLGSAAVTLSLLLLAPIYVTYSFALEWRYGRTPGKVNRGLVVVMADGSRCSLRASAVRNLLRYVDLLGVPPLVVGLVVALRFSGRRVGDLVAGTVVARAGAPDDERRSIANVETSAAARRRAGGSDGGRSRRAGE